ncbi:MAG: class I SAM-dependent methyltransferase [Firmicutes bacterium]|nr:class I SAM-dependent methyltransferase [Bacillota bacterium]
MKAHALICPVCDGESSLLDVVDFHKSCEERRGIYFDLSGIPIYYAICHNCGFCFAPEMAAWSLEQFETKVYNQQYVHVDPDYIEIRPREKATELLSMFPGVNSFIKHLDYGGGNGLLSQLLKAADWNSISYDPFVDKNKNINSLDKFDLITAYEVFEHVPDVDRLMSNLNTLLKPNGLVLFSTLLSDGNIHSKQRLEWWYASPRNGHISLFSKKSLDLLSEKYGWQLASFSDSLHLFYRVLPPWATPHITLNYNL